ncbi:MAG: hypothetical protein JST89_26200 [Cyanobacteria bacterium SZAS-4]|nr:hypothetical protein [Cyanobacteria bacterium SZAS-4]
MSNTFQVSDAYKPSDKQTSDANIAAQSLQVGANEMKAITGQGGSKNIVEAAGFASAEDLLAGFHETKTVQNADFQPKSTESQAPAATKSELQAALAAAKAHDESPESSNKLMHANESVQNTNDAVNFIERRTAGQDDFINHLTDKQLKLVGELADAIKNHDDAKLAEAMKSVLPQETNMIAFCVQYELQAKGVDNIRINSVQDGGKFRMAVIDANTKMAKIYDERTGEKVATKHVVTSDFSAAERQMQN